MSFWFDTKKQVSGINTPATQVTLPYIPAEEIASLRTRVPGKRTGNKPSMKDSCEEALVKLEPIFDCF